jgi:nucleosome binding factor SPN SPT16 subunit
MKEGRRRGDEKEKEKETERQRQRQRLNSQFHPEAQTVLGNHDALQIAK